MQCSLKHTNALPSHSYFIATSCDVFIEGGAASSSLCPDNEISNNMNCVNRALHFVLSKLLLNQTLNVRNIEQRVISQGRALEKVREAQSIDYIDLSWE